MNFPRIYFVIMVALVAAAIVLLYPHVSMAPGQVPSTLEEDILEVVSEASPVPWPTPPSASPLTSEPPVVITEPIEPKAAQVFRSINEQRNALGLASVVTDATLEAVAHLHADDMARRSYFAHTNPEGVTFEMRLDASGYSYITAAENLGFASHVNLIVPDWMRSPPHRQNIQDERFRSVGVATAQGTWQGHPVTYAVAVFTVPR